MVEMGTKLRNLRIEHKLTQAQVAERIGLAPSAVSSYESGDRYPTYDTLITLARMYHVSTDYLLGVTKTRTIDTRGLNDVAVDVLDRLAELLRNESS